MRRADVAMVSFRVLFYSAPEERPYPGNMKQANCDRWVSLEDAFLQKTRFESVQLIVAPAFSTIATPKVLC